jgi:hypothetical protein
MAAQDEAPGAFNINRNAQDAGNPITPLPLVQAGIIDGIHQFLPRLADKGGGAADIHLLRMRRAADEASKTGKQFASGEQEIGHDQASKPF